jgi:hypothetical protein
MRLFGSQPMALWWPCWYYYFVLHSWAPFPKSYAGTLVRSTARKDIPQGSAPCAKQKTDPEILLVNSLMASGEGALAWQSKQVGGSHPKHTQMNLLHWRRRKKLTQHQTVEAGPSTCSALTSLPALRSPSCCGGARSAPPQPPAHPRCWPGRQPPPLRLRAPATKTAGTIQQASRSWNSPAPPLQTLTP